MQALVSGDSNDMSGQCQGECVAMIHKTGPLWMSGEEKGERRVNDALKF